MKYRAVLFAAAIVASWNFAAGAQLRTAQSMMGSGMMGGSRMHPGGSVPGAAGTAPTPDRAGAVETICGFAGGNPTHGGAIYARTCVACHGSNGRGRIPGAPNFAGKGGVLSKPHAVLEAHIKNGFSSPNSPVSMPPGGGDPG